MSYYASNYYKTPEPYVQTDKHAMVPGWGLSLRHAGPPMIAVGDLATDQANADWNTGVNAVKSTATLAIIAGLVGTVVIAGTIIYLVTRKKTARANPGRRRTSKAKYTKLFMDYGHSKSAAQKIAASCYACDSGIESSRSYVSKKAKAANKSKPWALEMIFVTKKDKKHAIVSFVNVLTNKRVAYKVPRNARVYSRQKNLSYLSRIGKKTYLA